MATVTSPLVPMGRVLPSLTLPSITVPSCTPIISPTITSPLLHPHPTSPGTSTSVYRGFPPLRDHRSVPYPSPYLRYNSAPQSEIPGYQSPPGTISSQWQNIVRLKMKSWGHKRISYMESMLVGNSRSADTLKSTGPETGEVLCRIALWDCFGDTIASLFGFNKVA